MMYTHKKGFTLIELLVVIAIIGLLATIITASLSTARAKGRDARRIADIKTIQTALELYYNDNQFYPNNIYAASCSGTVTAGCGLAPAYIAVVPVDPNYTTSNASCASNGNAAGCYTYKAYTATADGGVCTTTKTIKYHLGAVLEISNNSALASDADAPTAPNGTMAGLTACTSQGSTDFTGLSAATGVSLCNGTAGTAQPGGTETCYDWTN